MAVLWRCQYHDILPSTQDAVRGHLADDGVGEGLVIQAGAQSAGRGRRGNQWSSPPGNLYMSILLRPACPPAVAGQMAFVVAVAVAAAIDDLTGAGGRLTLKWPNDVLVDGVKCAGILLESDLDPQGMVNGLIVGMGVNVNSAPDGRIGLAALSGADMDIQAVRDCILSHLADRYAAWRRDGFGPVRAAWMARAHGIGAPITARLQGGDVPGVFHGIDGSGALILSQPDGKTQTIHAGEVYFAQNA